jgi:antitoxin VapB
MALSIKNREYEETARELARVTGKSITEAGLVGLKRELERQRTIHSAMGSRGRVKRAMAIARQSAARPKISNLTDDEILGYDEFGAPTK